MIDFKNTIWKKLAADKKIEPLHFLQRAILTAVRSKSNSPKEDIMYSLLAKYFTPITNKNKLANGRTKLGIIGELAWSANRAKDILGEDSNKVFEDAEEEKKYFQLLKDLDVEKVVRRKYVYYFTIQEGLTPEQQGVQAGHALFALGMELGKSNIQLDPHSTYFQWIGVKNTVELVDIINRHPKHKRVDFYEPDVGHIQTSAAFYPVFSDKRRDFMDYELLVH